MSNYLYYQLIGGTEEWKCLRAEDISTLTPKPTFVTILASDIVFEKGMSREIKDKARYTGPMYFDLDSSSVDDSIAGSLDLIDKLKALGLAESDMAIYLSGKKGVHVVIPQEVFIDRLNPLQRLPAIYKEVAFTLAVDCLDFAVYTAGMGRMFRTTFNIRENGNYKVRISEAELRNCTAENYNTLCSAPRPDPVVEGRYRSKFALVFDAARQKATKLRPRKIKKVDAATLKSHQPTVERLMRGETVDGVGFNKVAIQLALYARECGISPDELIAASPGLLDSHSGDGYRYNTRQKREHELRRMCAYVEDNNTYEYALDPIRSMLVKVSQDPSNPESFSEDEPEDVSSGGVIMRNGGYWVLGGENAADRCVLAAHFANCCVLHDTTSGAISCLTANLVVNGTEKVVSVERSDFASSTNLHRLASTHGVSFMGTDINARGIYELMLRHIEHDKYVTECEGIDLISIPTSPHEEARKPFIVWSDYWGVRVPKAIEDLGISIQFQGYPEPTGVVKTDLSQAPALRTWLAEEGNKEALTEMLKNMFACQSIEVTSKILGWHVACFWRQLFHAAYSKFPLLHINGPAGVGKTEFTAVFLALFYWNQTPRVITPTSSLHAIKAMLGGSASVPVQIDEYKPQELSREAHNAIKLLMRDAYNCREVSKGGGNRLKENYSALTTMRLAAPTCFIAESVETESALLERSVIVTIRKAAALTASRNAITFGKFQGGRQPLSVLGANIAANITKTYSVEILRTEFDAVYQAARQSYMLQEGDLERLSDEEIAKKSNGRERLVYNHSVACFGLTKFSQLLKAIYGDEYEALFGAQMTEALVKVYTRMDDSVKHTMPEYIKVLLNMSDMTRIDPSQSFCLVDGQDFNLSEDGGHPVLHLAIRACYAKYRAWMRNQGQTPLFLNESTFSHSIMDSVQFVRMGQGTQRLKVDTVVLDYTALLRTGLPPFSGKVVALS